jgi:hypothetical protein
MRNSMRGFGELSKLQVVSAFCRIVGEIVGRFLREIIKWMKVGDFSRSVS